MHSPHPHTRAKKICNMRFSLGCCQMLWHENIHPLQPKYHPAMEKYYNIKKNDWKKSIAIMISENMDFYCKYIQFRRKLSAYIKHVENKSSRDLIKKLQPLKDST